MSKQWDPIAKTVYGDSHDLTLEAGVGAIKIPAPRPIMIPLCQCWPQRQTEEAGIVTNSAGIVYC